jgi:hypothetical protein
VSDNDYVFSIGGSLVSLNSSGDVANFSRPSPVNLERTVDGSLNLYPVQSYYPAFHSEDGSFLLEPDCANLVTWNLDLTQSIWLKGSNVTVRKDYAPAPDASYLGDRLRWDVGSGASQSLKRDFLLEADTDYTLSMILRLAGGVFGASDFLQITGTGTFFSVGLGELNDSLNRYKLIEKTFRTAGRQPVFPGSVHQVQNYAIAALTQNTLTLTIPSGYTINPGDWIGGQILVNNRAYDITNNTITGGTNVVTVTPVTLLADGVTTAMKAVLGEAPAQLVTIELYSESTVSIDWGGMQLEKRPFRTSMVYQDGEIEIRNKALLSWRHSPIAGMKTFGFFAELREWRGDGLLFDFGNLKASIVDGKLNMVVGSIPVNLLDDLPTEHLKIFLQISEANSQMSLYVNGILKAKINAPNFRADTLAALDLTSSGLRIWQWLIALDKTLLEGQVNVGDSAKAAIADLFNNQTLIDSVAISSHAPLINLNPVTVPGVQAPIAQSAIVGVDTGLNQVTLESRTGFVAGTQVSVMRGNYVVLQTMLTGLPGVAQVVQLASTYNALIDDVLVYGRVNVPGTASVRFPYDPVDPQTIISVTAMATGTLPNRKRFTIASALTFTKTRAYIRTALYQDVEEVIIYEIDTVNNYLYGDSISALVTAGCTIAQPLNEQLIDPDNYFAGIVDPIAGVSISSETGKYSNGVVVENYNSQPVIVTPYAIPYL